ncbi:MAG: hypothetical protein ACKE5M_00805 [Methylophilaceae bacterium]
MKRNSVILLLAGFLAACVTINIYFPAAAAQEVADKIINDVWQIEGEDKGEESTTKEADPSTVTPEVTPETAESK